MSEIYNQEWFPKRRLGTAITDRQAGHTWILTGLGLGEADGGGVAGLIDHANVHLVLVGIQSSEKTQHTDGLLGAPFRVDLLNISEQFITCYALKVNWAVWRRLVFFPTRSQGLDLDLQGKKEWNEQNFSSCKKTKGTDFETKMKMKMLEPLIKEYIMNIGLKKAFGILVIQLKSGIQCGCNVW